MHVEVFLLSAGKRLAKLPLPCGTRRLAPPSLTASRPPPLLGAAGAAANPCTARVTLALHSSPAFPLPRTPTSSPCGLRRASSPAGDEEGLELAGVQGGLYGGRGEIEVRLK